MKLMRYHNSPCYNPAASHIGLRDEMDRLFSVAFPALTTFHRDGFFGDDQATLPVDLYQQKDAFVIRAELPGFRKEDVHVEVADGVLTLTGHQKSAPDADKKDEASVATRERRVARSISLPENLQLDKIAAKYENGVLTVTLPKTEEVKPKQIAVEVK